MDTEKALLREQAALRALEGSSKAEEASATQALEESRKQVMWWMSFGLSLSLFLHPLLCLLSVLLWRRPSLPLHRSGLV